MKEIILILYKHSWNTEKGTLPKSFWVQHNPNTKTCQKHHRKELKDH